MTRRLVVAVLAALALFDGNLFYVGYGFYDVGADTPHWASPGSLSRSLATVRSQYREQVKAELPDLQNEELIQKGAGQ